MAEGRKIIAVNEATGERREYKSAWALACELGVTGRSVMQAKERNGVCKGWRVYPSAEELRERIAELERQIEIVEG